MKSMCTALQRNSPMTTGSTAPALRGQGPPHLEPQQVGSYGRKTAQSAPQGLGMTRAQ